MIRLLTLIFLCIPLSVYSAYDWPVVRIIDGDTIVVEAKWLPSELGNTISIRLDGVDTPERGWRAKCDSERTLSAAATNRCWLLKNIQSLLDHGISSEVEFLVISLLQIQRSPRY